jgi:hypothetical protein
MMMVTISSLPNRRFFFRLLFSLILGANNLTAQTNKIEIWETIHTRDFPNKCFFVPSREITHYLLEGAKQGKLKAFFPSDKFADFSKPMRIDEFKSALAYWLPSALDTSFIQSSDLKEFEIQGFLIPDNLAQSFEIKAISLINPEFIDFQTANKTFATFRWEEVKKYFNEIFRQSLAKESFEDLEAYWYHPEDNTLQISLAEALEKRYFKSYKFFLDKNPESVNRQNTKLSTHLIEQYYLPQILKDGWICNQKELYKPKKTSELTEPYFLKLPNGQLKTTTYSIINFQKIENQAYIDKSNMLVKYLLEGIKNQQITAYSPSYFAQTFDKKMKYAEVVEALTYYADNAGKSDTVPIQNIHLAIKRYFFRDIAQLSSKSELDGLTLIFLDKMGYKSVAYLKFAEAQKYLNDIYKNSNQTQAVWYNLNNKSEKMSFASALAQEKYESELIYFSNPDGLYLKEICYEIYKDGEDERVKNFIQQLSHEESQKIKKKLGGNK